MLKKCIKCGIEKGLDCFPFRDKEHSGIRNTCYDCLKVQRHNNYINNKDEKLRKRRLYVLNNKEKIYESNKKYRRKNKEIISIRRKSHRILNKEMLMLACSKKRAHKKGLEFNLTIEDINIPEYCPVLGIKLVFDNYKMLDDSPTLDRIDSKKGYIKGNVCVISSRANQIKSNGSIDEHQKVIDYMKLKGISN
jgi:hypothetical protein